MRHYDIHILAIITLVIALMLPAFISAQEKKLEEMTIEELMNVKVISASNRLQKLDEAPATIYVVTDKDIKQYGYRDLKDVLQHIPGIEYVYPQSHIMGGQRGFPGDWSQTKILINGRQVNMLFSGEVYVASQYPLNNVKQIEIVQGPASALYGADAFTGVINIITKNNYNTKKGSDFSFQLGRIDKPLNSKQFSFNTISKIKNLGITLGGTIFDQEGPDFTNFLRSAQYTEVNRELRNKMFDTGNPYRHNDKAYVANVDLSYSINDHSSASAGMYYMGNENQGEIENPEIVYTNFDMIVNQTLTYLNYKNNLPTIPLKLSVDAFREDENFYVRNQSLQNEGDNPPYLGAINIEGSKFHKVNVQFDYTPEYISNYLIAGFGYLETDIGEPAYTGLSQFDSTLGKPLVGRYLFPPTGYYSYLRPYLDQNKKYAYVQDQQSFFNNKLQITLGGRYDYHNIYGGITNIRSGLYYQFMKGFKVKALYGEAFLEPTIFELSDNPNLKPAKMKTWELSFHFNPIKNIAGQIVYYQNHASKLIQEERGTTALGSMWSNSGTKRTGGIEGLFKWRYNKLNGNVWYNYEYNPDDPDFLNVAKNKVGFGIIYNILRKISISLQGKYTDKIKTNAWDKNKNNIFIIIPEYKSINLTILASGINFSTFPDFDFSFSIYNLFNTRNLYPNVRGPNPNSYLAEGRSFYIKCRIHF